MSCEDLHLIIEDIILLWEHQMNRKKYKKERLTEMIKYLDEWVEVIINDYIFKIHDPNMNDRLYEDLDTCIAYTLHKYACFFSKTSYDDTIYRVLETELIENIKKSTLDYLRITSQ